MYVKELISVVGTIAVIAVDLRSNIFPFEKAWKRGERVNAVQNRQLPSSLVPLFQIESKCETILMKMTLICMKMKLNVELIFI